MFCSRFVLLAALATVFAAACGPSAAAPPSQVPASPTGSLRPPSGSPAGASGTPSATPSAVPSATPSAVPWGTPVAPVGSGDLSGVADLRQLLPQALGGRPLTATLFTGEQFAAFPESVSDQLRTLLLGLGRAPQDLTMAIASDATGGTDVTVTAFRVRDVQADVFLAVYVPLLLEAFPDATVDEATMGGKSVFDVSLDGKSVHTTFLYPRDDVLFIVAGTDQPLVDEAFRALP